MQLARLRARMALKQGGASSPAGYASAESSLLGFPSLSAASATGTRPVAAQLALVGGALDKEMLRAGAEAVLAGKPLPLVLLQQAASLCCSPRESPAVGVGAGARVFGTPAAGPALTAPVQHQQLQPGLGTPGAAADGRGSSSQAISAMATAVLAGSASRVGSLNGSSSLPSQQQHPTLYAQQQQFQLQQRLSLEQTQQLQRQQQQRFSLQLQLPPNQIQDDRGSPRQAPLQQGYPLQTSPKQYPSRGSDRTSMSGSRRSTDSSPMRSRDGSPRHTTRSYGPESPQPPPSLKRNVSMKRSPSFARQPSLQRVSWREDVVDTPSRLSIDSRASGAKPHK